MSSMTRRISAAGGCMQAAPWTRSKRARGSRFGGFRQLHRHDAARRPRRCRRRRSRSETACMPIPACLSQFRPGLPVYRCCRSARAVNRDVPGAATGRRLLPCPLRISTRRSRAGSETISATDRAATGRVAGNCQRTSRADRRAHRLGQDAGRVSGRDRCAGPPRRRRRARRGDAGRLRLAAQGAVQRHPAQPRAAAGRHRGRTRGAWACRRRRSARRCAPAIRRRRERAAMRRSPPHILVTTPESLYLLLTSESGAGCCATTRR